MHPCPKGCSWPWWLPCHPDRQSFAVLRGAVLGLQDRGDDADAAEASPEPAEEPSGDEQPHADHADEGHGLRSPQKQEQSQHLRLMVELLRPQDDIRLVRAQPPSQGAGRGAQASACECDGTLGSRGVA